MMGQGAWYSTLGFGALDIAIGAFGKCDEEYPGGPDSHGYQGARVLY